MTTTLTPAPTRPRRSAALGWIGVVAVATGTFSIVTTEMLPVGLLTRIGPDLGVSDGASGQLMTTASSMAFVAALTIVLVAGRLDRRFVLAGMMGVLLVANLVTALTDSFVVLLAARVMVGMAIGGFWAIGASLATRLVPERSVARASSVIFSGVSIASVAGVPAGMFIGDHAGWRAAFLALAGLSAIVLVAMLTLLPALPSRRSLRPRDLAVLLRNRPVLIGLGGLALIVIGHFTAYTYVTPALKAAAGIDGGAAAVVLLIYGSAGIAGTFVAGALTGGHLRAVLLTSGGFIVAATVAIPLLVSGPITATVTLIVWGLGYGAVPVGLQVLTLRSAPEAPEAVSALFVAGFQVAIGLGAVFGGVAVDLSGPQAPMWVGAIAAAAMVALVFAAVRLPHRPRDSR
ncbi:MFS transporter [Stackebrandtia nassauensis]|uniref:Major facilitator superfamily MFS_1 n=1 Tax=Stackebrandtia nassauensis (strain DSM 44728 / CIP 108903 / NRRL B-16338 / NBRC 102104 / LLR-40K-21) TaxID=446470 RepID=D3Q689_STANL|nr:MFS transporter [Stackebrandtia nassauensis]ADD42264.1 major facilitator superfamily MFS_1 [Stackebrandtia nassauensis DSM 44728]